VRNFVSRLMPSFVFVIALTASFAAQANVATPVAADPALEKHVTALTQELRCLQCQNQTIADSHASLAIDLKNQVREMLARGMSDQQVVDYMVQRYGDFVLFRPPVKNTTWLLWFGPFLLMLGGLALLAWKLAHRNPDEGELPASDLKRAAELLNAPLAPSDTKEAT
jgi:cytochrome c-type biogenesis protein CcmH